MLHLNAARLIAAVVPAPLHRLVLRIVHGLRVRWWRVIKHQPDDTRVVALDEAGRVLLVRHSYGSGAWMLPGGGSKHGEDALATAVRELREETGCALIDPVDVSGAALDQRKRRVVVGGRARGAVRIDGREIVEARWVAPDDLPESASENLRRGLPRWVHQLGEHGAPPPDPLL